MQYSRQRATSQQHVTRHAETHPGGQAANPTQSNRERQKPPRARPEGEGVVLADDECVKVREVVELGLRRVGKVVFIGHLGDRVEVAQDEVHFVVDAALVRAEHDDLK